jgi:hypothetical protein
MTFAVFTLSGCGDSTPPLKPGELTDSAKSATSIDAAKSTGDAAVADPAALPK